ncbi:MAG: peptidylprolyl isomerase [Thermoplasmatales archaeon]|nr:peptidylprolyl isomerase [Thermoplasmatales archaeon]
MASKKSQRKRANPVKKQSVFESKGVRIGIVIIFIAIVAIAAVYLFSGSGDDGNGDGGNGVVGNPIAIIDTSMGTIKVELYEDKVPNTCENFIKLANEGFYDGMIFHRIMDNFMIQAGNTYPDGEIKSSPYGNIVFESDPELLHEDGSISMASTGYAVGGSGQFFICDGAQSGLDGGYAVFGKTIEGIEVVRDIADDPHDNSSPAGGGKPLDDIIITSIIIEE